MRKIITSMLLLTSLLSGCAPATVEPTVTLQLLPTFTLTTTITLTPTLTSTPTITPTPSLPETLKIEIDEKIPENIATLATTTVNQAYWFYANLGCSPEFKHATFVSHESALTVEYEGILIGWDDLSQINSNMDVRISHEMAHVMCQLAITKDPNTGLELMWLLEGMANYITGIERFASVGHYSGQPGNIYEHEIGMGDWVKRSNLCDYPFERVERDTSRLGVDYPDYPGVGEVAAALLATTSPGGTDALINYYAILANQTSETAFQQAFGRTKEEFYAQFRSECEQNFPAFRNSLPTPTLAPGFVRVEGNVILKNTDQKYGDYVITFCKVNSQSCLPGAPINDEGKFTTALEPGIYRISVNSLVTDSNPGWYTSKGLVVDTRCAETVTIKAGQPFLLTIDFHYVSCR